MDTLEPLVCEHTNKRGAMQGLSDIKVGCCGFAVAQKTYFQIFGLIEIQSTFYQLPQINTAEKWRAAAPLEFEFTMKAWQLITHEPTSPTYRRLKAKIAPQDFEHHGRFRNTSQVTEAWNQTARFARALGASVVVFQCPASFRPIEPNVANMTAFFSRIDRDGLRLAWEPRGAWPGDLVEALCDKLELTHCVDPFKNSPRFGDFDYFRLHGITGFAYQYNDSDLERLSEWVGQKPSYVLFNNNSMMVDALRFIEMIQR